MDLLNDLTAALGMKGKETVYMSVTPSVGLEMILLDPSTKRVKAYACEPLKYDESFRRIADYDEFKQAAEELFTKLNISPKCNVMLNMPTVSFGYKDLGLLIENDGIPTAILSTAEDSSYIFKNAQNGQNSEPEVPLTSWIEAKESNRQDKRRFFYAAIQQSAINNIKAVFEEMGANLVGVEISLISILKALSFGKFTVDQMQDGITWNLMIVTANGYTMCSMLGQQLVDYQDTAIAYKSFTDEEVYKSICASAQLELSSYPANYLYVVSENDNISAKVLVESIPFR